MQFYRWYLWGLLAFPTNITIHLSVHTITNTCTCWNVSMQLLSIQRQKVLGPCYALSFTVLDYFQFSSLKDRSILASDEASGWCLAVVEEAQEALPIPLRVFKNCLLRVEINSCIMVLLMVTSSTLLCPNELYEVNRPLNINIDMHQPHRYLHSVGNKSNVAIKRSLVLSHGVFCDICSSEGLTSPWWRGPWGSTQAHSTDSHPSLVGYFSLAWTVCAVNVKSFP